MIKLNMIADRKKIHFKVAALVKFEGECKIYKFSISMIPINFHHFQYETKECYGLCIYRTKFHYTHTRVLTL